MSSGTFHGDVRPLQIFECEAIPSPESLLPGAWAEETSERGAVTLALPPEQAATLLFEGGVPRARVEIGDGVALCPRFEESPSGAASRSDTASPSDAVAHTLYFAIVAPVRCSFDVIASALNWWTNEHGVERLTVNGVPVLAADGYLAFAAALNPAGTAEG